MNKQGLIILSKDRKKPSTRKVSQWIEKFLQEEKKSNDLYNRWINRK